MTATNSCRFERKITPVENNYSGFSLGGRRSYTWKNLPQKPESETEAYNFIGGYYPPENPDGQKFKEVSRIFEVG